MSGTCIASAWVAMASDWSESSGPTTATTPRSRSAAFRSKPTSVAPSFAGWAIAEVYQASGDLEFVRDLYPKLVRYHQWWYRDPPNGADSLGIALSDAVRLDFQ